MGNSISDDEEEKTFFDKCRGTIFCCYMVKETEEENENYLYNYEEAREHHRKTSNSVPILRSTVEKDGTTIFIHQPSVGAIYNSEGEKKRILKSEAQDWLGSYSSYKSPVQNQYSE